MVLVMKAKQYFYAKNKYISRNIHPVHLKTIIVRRHHLNVILTIKYRSEEKRYSINQSTHFYLHNQYVIT